MNNISTKEEYLGKARVVNEAVKNQLNHKSIRYNWHEADVTVLEGVFARGDRKVAKAIETAYENGALFDAWGEHFDYQLWLDAFAKCGVDPDFYTIRGYGEDEILPWDPIDVGVTKKFLLRERKRAYEGKETQDCRHGCAGCGANSLLKEVECDV